MENLVTWYKFTFAVCRKHDAYSLLCVLSLNVKFSGFKFYFSRDLSYIAPLLFANVYFTDVCT